MVWTKCIGRRCADCRCAGFHCLRYINLIRYKSLLWQSKYYCWQHGALNYIESSQQYQMRAPPSTQFTLKSIRVVRSIIISTRYHGKYRSLNRLNPKHRKRNWIQSRYLYLYRTHCASGESDQLTNQRPNIPHNIHKSRAAKRNAMKTISRGKKIPNNKINCCNLWLND